MEGIFGGFLKEFTSVTVKVGQFVDGVDGYTPKTALSIPYTSVYLSKNGGTLAAKSDTNDLSHDALGVYTCSLNAMDTNTKGRLDLFINASGARPIRMTFQVLDVNMFDLLTTNGTGVTLSLRQLSINNPCGDAIVAQAGGDGHGIKAVGQGSGAGMELIGGSSGHGMRATGNGAGHGIYAYHGAGAGAAIRAYVDFPGTGAAFDCFSYGGNGISASSGSGSGHGFYCRGASTGDGLRCVGGAAASCAGIRAVGGGGAPYGPGGPGMVITGTAGNQYCSGGDGLQITGGAKGTGGSVDGVGMKIVGAGGAKALDAREIAAISSGVSALENAVVGDVSEPTAGTPPATPTLKQFIAWMWARFRNKGTMIGSTGVKTIYNSAGEALASKTVTDNGDVYQESPLTGA